MKVFRESIEPSNFYQARVFWCPSPFVTVMTLTLGPGKWVGYRNSQQEICWHGSIYRSTRGVSCCHRPPFSMSNCCDICDGAVLRDLSWRTGDTCPGQVWREDIKLQSYSASAPTWSLANRPRCCNIELAPYLGDVLNRPRISSWRCVKSSWSCVISSWNIVLDMCLTILQVLYIGILGRRYSIFFADIAGGVDTGIDVSLLCFTVLGVKVEAFIGEYFG